MSFPITYAQAEIEYRRERIASSFGGGNDRADHSAARKSGRRFHVARRPARTRLS